MRMGTLLDSHNTKKLEPVCSQLLPGHDRDVAAGTDFQVKMIRNLCSFYIMFQKMSCYYFLNKSVRNEAISVIFVTQNPAEI